MAIITIQTPPLNNIQKKRIGGKLLDSLHAEGVPASSVIVLFKPEDSDVYLDGGLLIEAKPHSPAPASSTTITTVAKPAPYSLSRDRQAPSSPPQPSPQPKRVAPEYSEVKERVRKMLMDSGGISSFQAQSGLALKGFDGASALLRRVFADLEAEGIIEKQGQKRGTRYVLKGITSAPPHQTAPVILVKSDKVNGQ
ncbi:MAG: hypothetical protein FWG12_02460 [Holophagaceae bacterium]|nr:hypothetical protein [Holophagaceae bacterium]